MKKILIPLVVVLLLAAGVYGLMQLKTDQTTTPPDNQDKLDGSQQTSETFDPKNPNFVLGSITQISPTQIDFALGEQKYSAQISPQTKLVKQVKDGQTLKVVDAVLSDFKTKQQIVVYFTKLPKDGVYQADKIQIVKE